MKHIVILGAGFGGIYAYKNLCRKLGRQHKNTKITVVSRDNFFLFSPMLHEVATGGLHPSNVVQPVREILNCKYDNFLQGKIDCVDTEKKQVLINTGLSIKYDKLVIALGATNNYFGTPGAEENAHPLKTLTDAQVIRNKCLRLLQEASEGQGKLDQSSLCWVVVGAGPTGVELAAELAEIAKDFAERAPNLPIKKLDIRILNASEDILQNFNAKIKQVARNVLRQHGIKIITNCLVKSVQQDGVETNQGNIKSKFILWTAGVSANSINIAPTPEANKGRLVVDDNLMLSGVKDVYVAGDMASVENVPQTAQAAVAMGEYVAKAIIKDNNLRPFKFKIKGMLLSLGQWKSVGNVGPIIVQGLFGWWLWRSVYLSKLLGIPNKIRTLVDWNINIFYRRDIAEL